MAAPLDSNARLFLERALRLGNAVLFTGAGFSRGASNSTGTPLPVGLELRELLWPLAFPSDPFDPECGLGDVFDSAVQQKRLETREMLARVLTVDPATLPETYRECLSIPWHRIYTLNIDTLLSACQSRFDLPHEIHFVSALRDSVPPPDVLAAIHLNGQLSDYPEITFSAPQYGMRAAQPDQSYAALARDLMTRPFVFIGTELNEPPLWQHMAMRGEPPHGRDLRPKSFLVIPELSRARAAMLERFKIIHIPCTTEEFVEEFLAPIAKEQLPRPESRSAIGRPFDDAASAVGEPPESPADFLLGREPSWGDVTQGFAIQRSFEPPLAEGVLNSPARCFILTGTTGSGKSTTLRRLALTLNAEGNKTLWLRDDAAESLVQIRSAALAADANFVAIDRAERFGHRGVELIRALTADDSGPRVIAAFASTKFDELGVLSQLEPLAFEVHPIPLLSDDDIYGLIDALTRAGRLGRLAGRRPEQQWADFKARAHRQLLVAMLEATSNQRFEDKIAAECEGLSADLVMAYIVTAVATSHRYRLRTEDLLAALSDVTPRGLDIVDRLIRQQLVLRSSQGILSTRHAVVARQVLAHYRMSGQLGDAIARLAFILASKWQPGAANTPERRLLSALTSHTYVAQVIEARSQIRQMYEELEPLLRSDPHYWLQRGSYELERGDISLAENFLAQAKGLSENNYMVQTEWGYLMLERACRSPKNPEAHSWFDEGLEILLGVIERIGARSPNTYVVLGDKTVAWAGLGGLSVGDRKSLLEIVRAAMKEGGQHHAGNRQFDLARDNIERVYLGLAVSRPDPT